MSLYSAFDKNNHLSELGEYLNTNEGVKTPSARRQAVLDNLFASGENLTIDAGVTFTAGVARANRQLVLDVASHAKLGGSGAGWVIGGDNALPLATLPASQTSEVILIPLSGLHIDDVIEEVYVTGQVESAGGNVTLTMDVRKITGAAAGHADASLDTDDVGTLTADTELTAGTLGVAGLGTVVAGDEVVYLVLTGTTAASTDIELYNVVVTYTAA